MCKRTSIFGWKSVLYNYGWKGFLLDSILPVIISIFLCLVIFSTDTNVYNQLKYLLGIGIAVVPAMVALILTAYTIMLTFIIGDKFVSIRNTKEGKVLIEGLNSSFAACLLVSTTSIITMIIVSSITNMNIDIENSNIINYPAFFFICYLLLYSISILIGIVIDIFNSGQTVLLDDHDNNKMPNT
jgi:hypothetical protein